MPADRRGRVARQDFNKAVAFYRARAGAGLSEAEAARRVKRRMETLGTRGGITVYDDFAHHPTAIATTLAGLRAKVGGARIVVAMEPRSNSMRLGAHAAALAPSLDLADAVVFLARPELPWDAGKVTSAIRGDALAVADADALIARLRALVRAGDHVVFMSNGGFDGAPRKFLAALGDGAG
jgi:UDP-N-acetylmuramate: L-alanyl-gamma-D-glutamyl-meso-diaminopimelate ligase